MIYDSRKINELSKEEIEDYNSNNPNRQPPIDNRKENINEEIDEILNPDNIEKTKQKLIKKYRFLGFKITKEDYYSDYYVISRIFNYKRKRGEYEDVNYNKTLKKEYTKLIKGLLNSYLEILKFYIFNYKDKIEYKKRIFECDEILCSSDNIYNTIFSKTDRTMETLMGRVNIVDDQNNICSLYTKDIAKQIKENQLKVHKNKTYSMTPWGSIIQNL